MKKIWRWLLQPIANAMIIRLKQIEDDTQWARLYSVALSFDNWCVNNDIYLN